MDGKLNSTLVFLLAITCLGAVSPCISQTPPGIANERMNAIVLEQQGDNAAAQAAWQRVLKSRPKDAEAYAHLGLLEARQEQYSEAIAHYRKALALNPTMPGLRLNLGLALFKAGEFKAAIAAFAPLMKSASASSPEHIRLATLTGMAHYGLAEYAAAIPFLKEAAASSPQNLPFRLALAHSCMYAKQYQCVLDVYHEILTLNAESAEADMLAGEALDEMRDHAGAIAQFRAAVKADPRVPNVHFGLGYLLWTQNQFEEAASEFKAELENVPDNAQALAYLGDCEMQLGKPDEALATIEKALDIDPSLARAHLDRGILYADQGRREEALGEFKLAAKFAPDDPNVHWRMARLYQSMGRKEEAKAEFDKTNSLHKAEDASVLSKMKPAHDHASTNDAAQPVPK